MKKNIIAAAVAALVLPAAAAAVEPSTLSYTYGQFGYADTTFDFPGDPGADGFALEGSYQFTDMFFGVASYSDLSGDADFSTLAIGAGAAIGLAPSTDGYATLSFVDVDFGLGSDDGLALEFGVRHMLNEQVELFGNLQYVDIAESETGFEIGGRYWFQKNFGASLSYETFDGDNTILIAGRYNF